MVDMSATLIHHGHIRLLKKASEYGSVVVGLTSDDEIVTQKHYQPELAFEFRKEILESIKYVDEVVATPWLINQNILDKYHIDLLVHGNDNVNSIDEEKLQILPRTKGISSTEIRQRVQRTISQINNEKLMLTPGPAVVLQENIQYLKPLFGRGDKEFTRTELSINKILMAEIYNSLQEAWAPVQPLTCKGVDFTSDPKKFSFSQEEPDRGDHGHTRGGGRGCRGWVFGFLAV